MDNNNIKVRVEGKNVYNYVKWLIKKRIDVVNLNIINHNKLELIISKKDYERASKYSKTYKVIIIKKYGKLKLLETIRNNSVLYLSIIIAIIFIYFLSNVIFNVEVIYNDQEVVEHIKKELEKYGIQKYKLKKDYSYLNMVKEKILKNNQDSLEWLEIINDGTTYIIKLVERKKEEPIKEYEYQSICATKDAIITNIKAQSGEKIKEVNDYVKKDELIVSGTMTKSNGDILYTQAKATVYGEVWYKIEIEYPYAYKEEKLTGKSKDVYVIKFLNNKIPIFSFNKYKEFKVKTNPILESNILPISLSKEKQYEVVVKEEIYTLEEVVSNAIEISKKKVLESNNKIINIKKVEVLKKENVNSKIRLSLFISVEEDITKVVEIIKKEENQNENNLQN